MMANTTKVEVLNHLRNFTHASRTNTVKKTLTNHDACAFIVWSLGPLPVREVRDLLLAWRANPKMYFTYLFNMSHSGGYGFVAERSDQRGNVMAMDGWNGIVSGKGHSPVEKTFFRRTYWQRIGKGVYGPTLECGKRMVELHGLQLHNR